MGRFKIIINSQGSLAVVVANLEKDGDGVKTLRSQLLIWGFLLIMAPALLFVDFFFRYELNQAME